MSYGLRALVVGYGSIGRRHARILTELGCQIAVVSRRLIDFAPRYADVSQALADWKPDYVVVANRTSEHYETIASLVAHGFRGRVLVEKPLFTHGMTLPRHSFLLAAVAYNLRCHPLLMKCKALLDEAARLVTANVYVGSYLPDWRPGTDYTRNYSARQDQGGGVLRDLSHELDTALWLFGPWRRLAALGGHLSSLEIDSDDAYTLLMETQRCPLVSTHLNYLDRVPRREILVNTDRHTVRVDLINGTMAIDGAVESVTVARDDAYRVEHQAMLAGSAEGLCTFEEAAETMTTIDAAEQACASQHWVSR